MRLNVNSMKKQFSDFATSNFANCKLTMNLSWQLTFEQTLVKYQKVLEKSRTFVFVSSRRRNDEMKDDDQSKTAAEVSPCRAKGHLRRKGHVLCLATAALFCAYCRCHLCAFSCPMGNFLFSSKHSSTKTREPQKKSWGFRVPFFFSFPNSIRRPGRQCTHR